MAATLYIVIPCYNEEEVLPITAPMFLEKLRALGAKYFPTKEKMEQEIADFAGRVQLVALHIEHLTGKHVREK